MPSKPRGSAKESSGQASRSGHATTTILATNVSMTITITLIQNGHHSSPQPMETPEGYQQLVALLLTRSGTCDCDTNSLAQPVNQNLPLGRNPSKSPGNHQSGSSRRSRNRGTPTYSMRVGKNNPTANLDWPLHLRMLQVQLMPCQIAGSNEGAGREGQTR